MDRALRGRLTITAIGIGIFVALFLVSAPSVPDRIEDIELFFDQSATTAFRLGEEHFSSHSARYSISRAETLFNIALARDSHLPLVHYQLARVAFLKGMYSTAIAHINIEINDNPDVPASAKYIRGLIEGYKGDYSAAENDYSEYLIHDPNNWAAINDYAWILIKEKKFVNAYAATERGLSLWPENAWLLNSASIALFEIGDTERARLYARRAFARVHGVTRESWLKAYPGNDPLSADVGLDALRASVMHNMLRIASTSAL